MDKFPARIHVLMSREASLAVVVRRGPSRKVCTVGWDRATDTFSIGQWLYGRIYERRSDVSPNGQLLIYFAMNGKWDSESKGSWTAISRAPFLKALGFWPKGDCWNGGGLFTSDKTFWLNGYGRVDTKGVSNLVTRDAAAPMKEHYGNECTGVYYIRLQRDGWKLKDRQTCGKWHGVDIFEKPAGEVVLRKLAHATIDSPKGKGCYYDEHELEDRQSKETVHLPSWEWAEVDRERLVWAECGRLYASPLSAGIHLVPQMLYDFNNMKFERLKAPY